MKNIIKIACWLMFILFVFCVTTSLAATKPSYWDYPQFFVYGKKDENGNERQETTAEEMVNALKQGKVLTNIGLRVKDTNSSIYCIERDAHLYNNARYVKKGNSITYPGNDPNGYARAYIYAAPGYIKNDDKIGDSDYKDERQYALWCLLGQVDDEYKANSDLYKIAMAYQEYKKDEDKFENDHEGKNVNVIGTNAKTLIEGTNLIYGPIKVEYLYQEAKGNTKSDEWGGFQYAFFDKIDKNNPNINSKVQLCTYENGTYTPVNFEEITEGESKGYYQIKESTYNNQNLYVVTQDKTLGIVTLIIKENKVDYTATVTTIEGMAYNEGHYNLCISCQGNYENPTTDIQTAISDKTQILKYRMNENEEYKYYKYVESVRDITYSSTFNVPNNVYIMGENGTVSATTTASSHRVNYCRVCKKEDCSETHYQSGHSCGYHNGQYLCMPCHKSKCGNVVTGTHTQGDCVFSSYDDFKSHFEKAHTYIYKFTKTEHYFEEFTGCDTDGCGTWVSAGYVHSQGLDIVETTDTITSNEIKLDIDINFIAAVDVIKDWDDNDDINKKRPSSITVKLLADEKDTGKQLELNAANQWTGTFENLDLTNSSGKQIEYSVQEVSVTGYESEIKDNGNNSFTITNKLKTLNIPVTKVWDDRNNITGRQPSSITVKLLADEKDTGKQLELNPANQWTGTFEYLPEYDSSGKKIAYTLEEVKINDYDISITGNQTSGFTITNTLSLTDISVTKEWDDRDNVTGRRPPSIIVKLLADEKDTGKQLELNAANQWTGTFANLLKYNANGTEIKYTIGEVKVNDYEISITGNQTSGFKIKNTLSLIDIPVTKIWNDNNNSAGKRPSRVIIKLSADGNETGEELILNEANHWTGTFANLLEKNSSGNKINYTIREEKVNDYETRIAGNQTSGFTVTNIYYFGYIEISGKVWNDGYGEKSNTINGIKDSNEKGIEGIKVILKDKDGNQFDKTSTAVTDRNGDYTIKVNYDNSYGVYKLYENAETVKQKIKTAYIEFEYNAMKYTTVAPSVTGENTSKAIENETTRNTFDNKYSKITSSPNADTGENEKIIASTKSVINTIEKYGYKTQGKKPVPIKKCKGKGSDISTNSIVPWNTPEEGTHTNCQNCKNPLKTFDVDVELIKYVNLGLFEREQPKVALTSDLTKVEVTMNGQKYTYKYGVKSDETKDVGLQAQFETKYTYEYKRPVNPSDIAYIQEPANKKAMGIVVTYQIKVANLSTTIPIKIHNIANYFDSRYTLNNDTSWRISENTGFYKAINKNDLNITLQPQTSSNAIEVSYTLSVDAILDLFNRDATLNHASEIEAYSSLYGKETIYAEQRTNGRNGKPYGGYDKASHPGNAGIHINSDARLDATKFEADTDIAPSFVLCKADKPKTLSGTIFEDTDVSTNDAERLGDGKYDASKEKRIQNVRVELYDMNGKIAQVYKDINSKEKTDGIVYSDENGNYAITGVVTGEYFIRYIYGDDTTELTKGPTKIGGTTNVNARDYKSTIITNDLIKGLLNKKYSDYTDDEKQWIAKIDDNYSVAVDNMLDRLDIEDLSYKNFRENEDGTVYIEPENMTAYTKPFITGVEFDEDKEGKSDKYGNIEEILLDDITNLNKLHFGIIERPREDIFIQKTITNINLTLANGQELISGNPMTDTLNYTKTMGFKQEINSGEAARNASPKRLLVEMDVELIQGSSMKLEYEVKVTNNNEIDYDYGNISDYGDIKAVITDGVNDEYITKSGLAKYYYFGDKTGLNEINSVIELVDYLNEKVIYEVDETKWTPLDAKTDLYDKELISSNKYNEIKDGEYKMFKNASGVSMTLASGTSWTQNMSVSKKLANLDENVYDNGIEILKIDAKTARTIQAIDENGDGIKEVVEKTYKPGNYEPGSSNGEQDDDIVEIIITPPTGIVKYIVTYLIAGLVGLIVIAVVVIFIKKNMTKR